MHFGIFMEEDRPGLSPAAAFEERLALVDRAEAWGFDGVWLGELHFNPSRSILSAPMVWAGAIAARTRRLRVGTAVQVLPLGHPLRIAEEAATVDHLSRGRLDLGIGRSGSPRAYDVLGVPYAESQARFREALDVMRQAWKGEPFSYHGEFYRFESTTVAPRPRQSPHPPLRMAANTPDTFALVGELGLPLFVGLRDLDIPELGDCLKIYRHAWREAGHAGAGNVYLRMPVYAGATEALALEEPRESITYFFQRHVELMRSGVGRAGMGPAGRRQQKADQLAKISYEEIRRTRVAFGSAPALVDRLGEIRDELGLDGLVVEPNAGGLIPPEQATRSLEILARDVLPAFR